MPVPATLMVTFAFTTLIRCWLQKITIAVSALIVLSRFLQVQAMYSTFRLVQLVPALVITKSGLNLKSMIIPTGLAPAPQP